MVQTAGSVEVDIRGNVDPLSRSMNRARQETNKFDRSLNGARASANRASASVKRAAAVNDNYARSTMKASAAAKQFFAGFVTVTATAGLTRFIASTVKAASDVDEMRNLLKVTFEDSIGDVETWANATADAVNRSRFDLLRFAGDFATFLKPLGTAPDQVRPMSQALTQLTVDLASFRNLAEADVFTKLMSGLAGETEAVRRLGIDLGATAISQELLRQGVNKTSDEASQAQKVMARYAIIMRQTTDAQGDAARTADSFENKTKLLAAEIHDLQVAIGRELMPVADEMLTWTIDMVKALGGEDGPLVMGIRGIKDEVSALDGVIQDFVDRPSLFTFLQMMAGKDVATALNPAGANEQAMSNRERAFGEKPLPRLVRPGATTTPPPPGEDVNVKETEKIDKLIEALRHQRDQLDRTSRAQAQYDALQKAGITTDHARAGSIMRLAGALYDAEAARERSTQFAEAENIARSAREQAGYNALLREGIGIQDENARAVMNAAVALYDAEITYGLIRDEIEHTQSPMERYAESLRSIEARYQSGRMSAEEYSKATSAAARQAGLDWKSQAASIADSFGAISRATANGSKEAVAISKAAAITQGLINSFLAGTKALKELPFPANIAAAAAAAAAGLSYVAQIRSLKGGGMVQGPGTGTSDSIPANLSNGEFVVNARSTQRYRPVLERINNFAEGGFVGRSGGAMNAANVIDAGDGIRVEVVSRVDREGNLTPFVESVSGRVAGRAISVTSPSIIDRAASRAGTELSDGTYDGAMGQRYGQQPRAPAR